MVANWAFLSLDHLNWARMDLSELNTPETWSAIGWEATAEGGGKRTGAVPRCRKVMAVVEHSSGLPA